MSPLGGFVQHLVGPIESELPLVRLFSRGKMGGSAERIFRFFVVSFSFFRLSFEEGAKGLKKARRARSRVSPFSFSVSLSNQSETGKKPTRSLFLWSGLQPGPGEAAQAPGGEGSGGQGASSFRGPRSGLGFRGVLEWFPLVAQVGAVFFLPVFLWEGFPFKVGFPGGVVFSLLFCLGFWVPIPLKSTNQKRMPVFFPLLLGI